MKKYFTHVSAAAAIFALPLLSVSCGDKEKEEDAGNGKKQEESGDPGKSAKGPDKGPDKVHRRWKANT